MKWTLFEKVWEFRLFGRVWRVSGFDIGTFLIMVVNLFGTVLNNHKRIEGFYVWALCNVLWACVNFSKGIFWQGIQNLIFLALNFQGILCWR